MAIKILSFFLAASLLGFSALAADISLTGVVVSLHKNPSSDGFLVKIQGMDKPLQVSRGPSYLCLRQGLNSQEPIAFSFDTRSAKIQSCEHKAVSKL